MDRNHPGAGGLHTTQEFGLDNIAGGLTIGPDRPAFHRGRESSAFPPLGIEAGEMTGNLKGSCFTFPDAIRGHEQPFLKPMTRCKKIEMFEIVASSIGATLRKEGREPRRGPAHRFLNQSIILEPLIDSERHLPDTWTHRDRKDHVTFESF